MSTIFTHLFLYSRVFTQGFFFACLTPSVALTFSEAFLLCFSPPHPGCHLELSLCQPQKNVNQLLRRQNQREKPFLPMWVFFVHAFIQGHLTLPARGESQPSVSLC